MINDFPSIWRLSCCMLLSAGLHGGMVFYDWTTNPAESVLTHDAVMVTVRPVVDFAAQDTERSLFSEAKPDPVENRSASLKAAPPAAADRPMAALPESAPHKSFKSLPVKSPGVVNQDPDPAAKPPGMVCMIPQDIVPDGVPQPLPADLQDSALPRVDAFADEVITSWREAVPPAVATVPIDKAEDPGSTPLVEAVANYRSNPLPEYPYLARQRHWQGVVWLLVDVSAEGLVNDLKVEQSCGHRLLDRTAGQAVRRWQFSPASRAGLPVASQVRIPVRFHLEDG